MNFVLLGYILSWLGIIYSVGITIFTFYIFTKLSAHQQSSAEITLGIPFIIFIISLVYIITYHIS